MIGFLAPRTKWALALMVTVLLASLGMLLDVKQAHAKTFVVNSKQDFSDVDPGDGICDTIDVVLLSPCTLRGAIQEANFTPAPDTIHFDIPLSGVQTIKPNSQLTTITAPVTIDGYTQGPASENTLAQGNNAVLRIELDGSNAPKSVLPDGLLISASNCVVRGLVINRFGGEGIQLSGSNNKVEGNFIGTNASGLGTNVGPQDPGNHLSGVITGQDASGNTIGGTTPESRNIISANSGAGVRISSSSSSNVVQGNSIGLAKNGGLLGNSRSGVEIVEASDNTVGGNTAGASNTIAGNGGGLSGGNGVTVVGAGATGNRILRNSITANEDLGIDLSNAGLGDGVTPNDNKDPDAAANGLQNFPVLTSATSSGNETTIKAKLNSKPNQTFVIRFFANPSTDTAEGKTYIGQKSVTTNQNGNTGTFTFKPTNKLGAGDSVTATATNSVGNTSEFSAPRSVVRT